MAASFPLVSSKDILHPKNLRRGSVEGYPPPEEPPCEYTRRFLRRANIDNSSCHTKCTHGLGRWRRPASEEREKPPIPPKSKDGERRGWVEEPPDRPG